MNARPFPLLSFLRDAVRLSPKSTARTEAAGANDDAVLPALLARVDRDLVSLALAVESTFTAAGAALHQQLKITRDLSEQSRGLRDLAETLGGESSPISRIVSRDEQVLAACRETSLCLERVAGAMDQYEGNVSSLMRQQEEILRLFAPLQCLQALFKIEAANLSQELQSAFLSVTEEIRRIDREVFLSFEQQAAVLGGLIADSASAGRELKRLASGLSAEIEASASTARVAMETFSARRAQDQLQDSNLAANCEIVLSKIDSVAVALQYQDITRQKLEHVRSSLSVAANQDCGNEISSRDESVRLRVEASQLRAIAVDLQKAIEAASVGMGGIRRTLDDAAAHGLSIVGQQKAVADMRAIVEAITAAGVSLARSRLAAGQALANGLATLKHFSEMTGAASGTMRRFAADLRIMGLNAQILSVHVGNGGLEVLSAEASRISQEAGSAIDEFDARLQQTAAELRTTFEGFPSDSSPSRESHESELAPIFGELSDLITMREISVGAAVSLLEELREQQDRMVNGADFSAIPVEMLEGLANDLESRAGPATTNDENAPAETRNALMASYTMNSERSVCATVLGGDGGPGELPADGDIEFFEAPTAPEEVQPAPESARAPDKNDNVEFF